MSLTTVIVSPSLTAMPADSCPRCCNAYSPRYVLFATCWPGAYMPMTPHASRGPERSESKEAIISRTEGVQPLRARRASRILRRHGPGRMLCVVHRSVGCGEEHDRRDPC